MARIGGATVQAGGQRPNIGQLSTTGIAGAINRLLPDRALAILSALLLAVIIIALLRGRADWGRIPWQVWPHLATMGLALALTPVMLLRRKGNRSHRVLGYVWVTAMMVTALFSFTMRFSHPGHFSFIHLISIYVCIMVPLIVIRARQHDPVRHHRAVRGMVIGALLIAGFFTFPFDRLLGHWLFG